MAIKERDKLIQMLTYELRRMATGSFMYAESIAHKIGINETDVKCAEFLLRMGPMSAGKLAKLSGLSTGAITNVVDRLEKAGWVQREADPHDRRKVIIRTIPENPRPNFGLYDSYSNAINELISNYDRNQLDIILNFIKKYSEITFKMATDVQ